MSSYRNYYSTRSDAQEPRFSSITPSTYRPSFSGGTYRIKRDPISTTPSYVSRYTTSTATSKDSIKDKLSESAKTTTSKTLPTPSSSSSSSVLSKSQPSSTQRTYGSSTTIARDNTCNHGKPRYTATASTPSASVSKYGLRSRDPSPATDRRSTNNLTTSRIKSRDPSPSPSTIRGKSRDPSPAVDIKPKVGSYSSAYRLGSRTSSSGYSSHYGSNASLSRNALTDKSISYLSCSDFSARTVSRAREIAERKSNENELKDEKSSSTSVSSKSKSSSQSKPQNEITANKDSEESQFIAIEVVTRGTSPTPPGTTTVTRTRRIDLAKTIEKTIQRSKIKPQMDDKEIQSDRLDDPTRYSRFGLSSRMSSYSPHSDRYSSSLRYTNSPLSNKSSRDTTSRSESESKKDDSTSKSSINKSSNLNTYSSTKVDRSKNSPETKTKISPPKTTIQMTIPKQKSPESTTTNSVGRSLPPVIPKGESPTKTVSSTSTSNIAKLPNKDFRKSALNVGPTDRPRKSRTPSVGTDTEDKADVKSPTVNGTIQLLQRLERSPSIGSETGSSSSSSSTVSSSHSSATNKNIKSRLTSTTSKPKLKAQNTNIDEQSLISRDTSTNSNATATTTGGSATGSYKKMETTATTTTTSAYSELDDSFINNARRIVTGMSAETQMNQQPLAAMNSRNTSITNVSAIAAISTNTITATPNLTTAQTTTTTTTTASTSSPQPYKYHQINNSPATDSSASTFAKNTNDTDAKTFLIRKLESVSNFFAARQHDTNSEPMFLDTTSSSSQNISLSSDGRKQEDNSASVLYTELTVEHPQTTTITTTASNPNTDTTSDPIDDSSWWLDTSRQINTESALDIKDEMKYRIRHIDSGEAAWWIRNDEDDTLAEDLKTLNQEDPSEINDCSLLQNSGDSGNLEENSCWWGGNDVTISGDSNTQLVEQVAKVEKAKSEEPPWWLNHHNLKNTQNNCNDNSWWDTENSNMENNSNNAVVVSKSDSSNRLEKAKVSTRFEECGEKALWQDETNNVEQTQTKAKIELSNSDNSVTNNLSKTPSSDKPWWMSGPSKKLFNIRHVESGEKAWWMQDNNEDESVCQSPENDKNLEATKKSDNDSDNNDDCNGDGGHKEEIEDEEIKNIHNNIYPNINEISLNNSTPPLGDRASPEGLEDPVKNRKSPYDNIPSTNNSRSESSQKLFISRHTNIDEILGGSCRPLRSPIMDRLEGKNIFIEEITPEQVRIHDSRAQNAVIQRIERDEWDYHISPQRNDHTKIALDDAALQVYKDGDYGAYLDLESSLAEQSEEIEGLHSSRKNSLVVRTQLSVRVHAIIEKLLSSEGSELRRALFSLKQIFQEDKDLVHGFVALGGLNCLVRVGNGADQNYQNYILRALGQVMLYVDGMNGVMKHGPTVQWLYSLIASKYRLVVKTALKLLLVFVEYVESNCYLLVNAIHVVDIAQGNVPWTNIMKLLKDYENADTELLIYATSLINKTLSGLSDQDSFYDESDLLEQQGMEGVIQRYMSRPGTDLDLLDQLQLYEAVLKFEDGEADSIRVPHNSVRQTLRYSSSKADSTERRKSRRHSTGTSPAGNKTLSPPKRLIPKTPGGPLDEDSSSSSNSNEFSSGVFKDKGHREEAGVTPALRRRRERAERHKSFMREQQEATANNGIMAAFEKREELESDNEDRKLLLQLKKDHTVKDLTQKLSNLPTSPTHEEKPQNRIGDMTMTGLISKAKEGLAKSKSKGEISRSPSVDQEIKKAEPKKSENELHWDELVKSIARPLTLCDLDFTDLHSDDEKDVLAPRGLGGGVPPPPPPLGMQMGMPLMMGGGPCPPPPSNLVPPLFNYNNSGLTTNDTDTNNPSKIKKNKKTVKLFWKEVREDMIPVTVGKTIWDELPDANVDIQKLEHLFESRAKDLMTKEKQQEMNKNKEIIVLDHKRSNAINIAITKLPPPRAIKAAILKMDATVVTREGIDKLLNMLPTEEERGKIQEAQMSNPELPLGSAEQFLLTLASISELSARLKLWAFKLDFENSEKEIAEPLMDLKQGIELLRQNRTFKCILSTLLSVGIFLNGAPVKGFQIEYLAKVPEVKDTVHKHSLLHHLCHMVMESSSDTTDLYSEIGPITRSSKADFTELAHNLVQLETECKASWDRLKLIAKHDCPPQMKQKLVDFLADCAERIILLQIVHRRVINRYRKFLLWLGIPQHSVAESRPNEFCRIVSEFALEYRTTRERVQQQIEKKANHRERNKTRGKMIIDVTKFRTQEDRADAALKELLGSPNPDSVNGTLTWRRRRAENLRSPIIKQNEENFTDGDDEILESLVKTATKAPGARPTPRERKRTRHADRKSLRRTLKNGLTEEEKQHVSSLIKSY